MATLSLFSPRIPSFCILEDDNETIIYKEIFDPVYHNDIHINMITKTIMHYMSCHAYKLFFVCLLL